MLSAQFAYRSSDLDLSRKSFRTVSRVGELYSLRASIICRVTPSERYPELISSGWRSWPALSSTVCDISFPRSTSLRTIPQWNSRKVLPEFNSADEVRPEFGFESSRHLALGRRAHGIYPIPENYCHYEWELLRCCASGVRDASAVHRLACQRYASGQHHNKAASDTESINAQVHFPPAG